MSEHTEAKPVYMHDCPALGKNTKIIESTMLSDGDDKVLLYRQNKCPFCSKTAGEKRYGRGVIPLADGGYSVDMGLAEKFE